MTNISQSIFRSLYEGKWLFVEYKNISNETTKYWIAINDIDVKRKSLHVTGLHLASGETKGLFLYAEKIIDAFLIDGSYYKRNENLLKLIEAEPENYQFLFSNITNLKILQYLADCYKLQTAPQVNKDFALIKKLDAKKLEKGFYKLSQNQFKEFISSFTHFERTKHNKNFNTSSMIALNVCSIMTSDSLYVLAYKNVLLDVKNKSLIATNQIYFSKSFQVQKGIRENITTFLDFDELELLDNFEENAEQIKDLITRRIRFPNAVDDNPYFMVLYRQVNVKLENEYAAILKMYSEDTLPIPLKAFFGNLRLVRRSKKTLPIFLLDKKCNIDQMLAIDNAMNTPLVYVQGPPGTGKTKTIINTIVSAFFNGKTVLLSSFNNHPIDSVIEKLISITYKNNFVPFPIFRIGNKEKNILTLKRIKENLKVVKNFSVHDNLLIKDKDLQVERTEKLKNILTSYQEKTDLEERSEIISQMLTTMKDGRLMPLQINLYGEQENVIQKRIAEIGNITEEDAVALLNFDYKKIIEYLNFMSVKLLNKLQKKEYESFMKIVYESDEETQNTMLNTFCSKPENIKLLQKVFPVFCSTTISASKIGQAEVYFDITIIDEAAQCEIATSLIPILRAKHLMLVGDSQQLQPVITLDKNANESLKAHYNVKDSYDYIENSIYKAFLNNDTITTEVLLRTHYRCAKKIIEFNNKKYYNKQLIIKSPDIENSLSFYEVKNNTTDYKNTAPSEADAIIRYIKENPQKQIGVITAFRNQKQLIDEKLRDEGLLNKVSCGTVHAFQGDERDEIIFSLALTNRTNEKTYGWLKNNKQLINVASSRAKEKLIIFGSSDELKRLSKIPNDDDLFDLVNYTKQNGTYEVVKRNSSSRALGIKPYTTQTEEAFLKTLEQSLSNVLDKNYKYFSVQHEVALASLFIDSKIYKDYFYKARIDFVVRTKTHKSGEWLPVFGIELDGQEHKDNPFVIRRDKMKQAICAEHNFELLHVDNTYARRYIFIKSFLEDFFKKDIR